MAARRQSGLPHMQSKLPRQPKRAARNALNGQQTVLAKPPNSVTAVIAVRERDRRCGRVSRRCVI